MSGSTAPLDRVYPVIFIDAIMVKIRDRKVANRPIYVAIGVSVYTERDTLGLWAGEGRIGGSDANNRTKEPSFGEHPVRMRPGTKTRRRSRGQRRTAPIVSLEQLLKVAVQMPQPYGVAALLTTFAGLRGGKVFALAVRHLRYGPTGVVSHVRVERTLVELSGQPMAFGPPNTDAGVREVAVPAQIGQLLIEHIVTLNDDPENLLFRTVTGRMVTSPPISRDHQRPQEGRRGRPPDLARPSTHRSDHGRLSAWSNGRLRTRERRGRGRHADAGRRPARNPA